jgi:hypothetical protein
MYALLVISVLAVLLTPLAILLIRFNRKRLRILRCARAASHEQLENIYSLLERLQPEWSGAVLARTNRAAPDQEGLIPLPSFLEPWGGRVVAIRNDREVVADFVPSSATEPRLSGRIFRLVPMPPTAEADWDNVGTVFSRVVTEQPGLQAALSAVCPDYPAELLQCLLSGTDTFELDPINQVQLSGSPVWVQDEECPSCDVCRRQMSLIVQLPGALLPERASPRGTFYFFGCSQHPEQTRTVAQFT